PAPAALVDEDHVIELVDGLEAEDERGITVRFEDDRCEQRRFEAMRAPVPDNAAKAAQRGPSPGFLVVAQAVEILLDGERCAQPRDEPPLVVVEKGPDPFFAFACVRQKRSTAASQLKSSVLNGNEASPQTAEFTTSDRYANLRY